MITRLDRQRINRLSEGFPCDGWKQLESHTLFKESTRGVKSNWKSIAALRGVGGVYVILLPSALFHPFRALPLHAPHRFAGHRITFEFTVDPILPDGYGVVYVGRTTDLENRWRGHLSRGERKNGGQVRFGLMDCGLHATQGDDALLALRRDARIIFTELSGPENCANRDLLELTLCARFAPPFNIKSER